MFKSCGYFSSYPCPFFLNDLCERPYCHFRHSRHDVEKNKVSEEVPSSDAANNASTSSSSSSVLSSSSLESFQTSSPAGKFNAEPVGSDEAYFTSSPTAEAPLLAANSEQATRSFAIPSFTDNSSKYQVPIAEEPEQYMTASPEKSRKHSSLYSSSDADPSSLPTYLPTPKTPSLPVPKAVTKDTSVPLYQPTPKRELKRRHVDQNKVKGSNMEYDPECNYSCGGLTKSGVDSPGLEDSGVDYKPSAKKLCTSSHGNKRKVRLSCESLIASSPSVVELEDNDMDIGAQFSEEEFTDMEGTKNSEEEPECFENIGDDDISSESGDDLIDVPLFPEPKKSEGNKSEKKKSASAKKGENNTKHSTIKPGKTENIQKNSLNQKKKSKEGSFHTSNNKVSVSSHSKSKSSNSSSSVKSDKSNKADKSPSTQKRSSSSSTKDNAGKSTKLHKTSESSKTNSSSESSSKHKSDKGSNSKLLLDKHTSSKDSSNASSSRRSSSAEVISSSKTKHISSSKESDSHPNADRKSSGSKQSTEKHLNDGKKVLSDKKSLSSDTKISSNRRSSSSDTKISSNRKSSSSDTKISSNRQSSSSGKRSETSMSNSSSSKTSSSSTSVNQDKVSRKSSSASRTHSDSSKKGELKHSSGDGTKRRSDEKQKVAHQKQPSSSSKTSGSLNTQKADSSSHLKDRKSVHKTSDSDVKNYKKTVDRMNSELFGDDSDNDVDEIALITDTSDGDGGMNELTVTNFQRVAEEPVDYSSYIHDSDFEDEDTFDECFRIFKEGVPQKVQTNRHEKKLAKDVGKSKGSAGDGAEPPSAGKKRTAHENAKKREPQKKYRPQHMLSATEVMHNRMREMQRKALEKAAVQEQEVSSTSGSAAKASLDGLGKGGDKKRLAHVPKPATPSTTPKNNKASSQGEKKTTLAITASKSEKRTAHTPNLSNLKRPVIPSSFGSKVPSNIRQRYLNLIIDECLKFCPSEETAYKKGLEEESGVYERASNKNIYLRVAVNTITRLRAEAKESLPGSSKSQQRRSSITQSHQATLGGSRAAKTSFTLHRSAGHGKKVEVELTVAELYQKLLKYCMTEEQLKDNGYPRPNADTPGKPIVLGTRYQDTDKLLKDNERTCSRCGKRFIVHSDGTYAFSEECVYHWTRAYPRRKSGFIQHIYNCCNSDTSSKGCQVGGSHVHENNKHRNNLSGFMQTMPRSPPRDGNFGIYALDCEMVYTLGGLELARVTVVNTEGESVFESLVQPFHPIIDYNTRFSGLTAADLKDVTTTLIDVQAILLSRFSSKSILIGHSLESDLLALKLIHSTVVDTSVVFPHRLGPPYKRALKNLMLETFQKIIQDDAGGHDSKEDAVSCLQLMKWRIKEDSKRENRYL